MAVPQLAPNVAAEEQQVVQHRRRRPSPASSSRRQANMIAIANPLQQRQPLDPHRQDEEQMYSMKSGYSRANARNTVLYRKPFDRRHRRHAAACEVNADKCQRRTRRHVADPSKNTLKRNAPQFDLERRADQVEHVPEEEREDAVRRRRIEQERDQPPHFALRSPWPDQARSRSSSRTPLPRSELLRDVQQHLPDDQESPSDSASRTGRTAFQAVTSSDMASGRVECKFAASDSVASMLRRRQYGHRRTADRHRAMRLRRRSVRCIAAAPIITRPMTVIEIRGLREVLPRLPKEGRPAGRRSRACSTASIATSQAVRGIDLDVEEGEFVAFLGPNGAGKTTTLKLLSGVINPTGRRGPRAGLRALGARQRLPPPLRPGDGPEEPALVGPARRRSRSACTSRSTASSPQRSSRRRTSWSTCSTSASCSASRCASCRSASG